LLPADVQGVILAHYETSHEPKRYTLADGVQHCVKRFLKMPGYKLVCTHHFLFIDKASVSPRSLKSGKCLWAPALAYAGFSVVNEAMTPGTVFLVASPFVIRLTFTNNVCC